MENIFQTATRNKIRWNYKGFISVEELWDLSLSALDGIFKSLKKEERDTDEESLLGQNKINQELQLENEIIKYIVAQKQAEILTRETANSKKEEKQFLMKLYEQKTLEEMKSMSKEDIAKLLSELDD